MADPEPDVDAQALTDAELEAQEGSALPDREAMSTITGSGVDNFAVPINEALAINIESTESVAIADADQIVILEQTDVDGVDGTTDDGTADGPGQGLGHGRTR